MGLRSVGCYATVWEVSPKSAAMTKGRIAISKKNKMTDQYEQDFSAFVWFCGTTSATNALKLKPKDHIRIKEFEVKNEYNKEAGKEYWNVYIYDFEDASFESSTSTAPTSTPKTVDPGMLAVNDELEDEGLPFDSDDLPY